MSVLNLGWKALELKEIELCKRYFHTYFLLTFPTLFSTVNTYLFMVQAQGILLRDNVRTIGAQVYEQVVRSAYAKRNSSLNDSGKL